MPTACPLCHPDPRGLFHSGELILGMWESRPLAPGHALLVTRRHVADWLAATIEERRALTDGIATAWAEIRRRERPVGFSFGIDVDAAAARGVAHLHLNVIPCYGGDVAAASSGAGNANPGVGLYPVDQTPPAVHDQQGSYVAADATPLASIDSTAFGERMLQLLDEGDRSTTYKLAVLLALVDLCIEQGPPPAGEVAVSTRRLAERVLELYWPQTARYDSDRAQVVLAQSFRGQAEIVTVLRRFREAAGADPSEPLYRTRLRDPKRFERLVTEVEWKLIEMPIPKLQRVNGSVTQLLYRVGWDDRIKRSDAYHPQFDRHIYLRPGVSEHLLRLAGLLRPLIQQAWTGMIVKMNRDATDEAQLTEFLFGARRIALAPVQRDLRELQDNRCFYCDGRIDGSAEVDHFIPWARHPDNSIGNLVLADARCNNSKRDFLAAADHVTRWTARFEHGTTLADIATRAGWETHPTRTLETARSIYSRLPDDVRLWLDRKSMVAVAEHRGVLNRSLGLSG